MYFNFIARRLPARRRGRSVGRLNHHTRTHLRSYFIFGKCAIFYRHQVTAVVPSLQVVQPPKQCRHRGCGKMYRPRSRSRSRRKRANARRRHDVTSPRQPIGGRPPAVKDHADCARQRPDWLLSQSRMASLPAGDDGSFHDRPRFPSCITAAEPSSARTRRSLKQPFVESCRVTLDRHEVRRRRRRPATVADVY